MQMNSQTKSISLAKYVDYLQSTGHYVFSVDDAKKFIQNVSEGALRLSISRLIQKKRIARLRHGCYVIVPLEYKTAGAPPPSWYIDFLMKHSKLPYYVGLLTAAALHSAAHQQPQIFQVITTKPQRPTTVGKNTIEFIVKKTIPADLLIQKITHTGHMIISSPELTALDIVQYVKSAGYWNNVATVLIELTEAMNSKKLAEVAKTAPISTVQRLGYLLETFTEFDTEPLYSWIKTQETRSVPLRADKKYQNTKRHKRWKILINEKIEPDL